MKAIARFTCAWVAVIGFFAAATQAGFVNGRESFTGTTFDTNTWEPFTLFGVTISQNNALRLTSVSAGIDYTTKSLTVGPGQTVRTVLTMLQADVRDGTSTDVCLLLTTNSAGTTRNTYFDDAVMGICTGFWINSLEYSYPAGGGNPLRQSGQAANTTLVYEVTRNSHTSATFTVRDLANNLIGTLTDDNIGHSTNPPFVIPDQLHISVFAQAAVAEFQYIEVVAPEPAMILPVFAGVLLFGRRRIMSNTTKGSIRSARIPDVS